MCSNQTRDDHGGIAFMHLNSSGALTGNVMATCPGTPLLFQRVPHALDRWVVAGNTVDGENATLAVAPAPVVHRVPSPPGTIVVAASSAGSAAGTAVLRYTLDGSRPTATAPTWPASGQLSLPPRAVAVLVKAFPSAVAAPTAAGGLPVVAVESPTDGGVFEAEAA